MKTHIYIYIYIHITVHNKSEPLNVPQPLLRSEDGDTMRARKAAVMVFEEEHLDDENFEWVREEAVKDEPKEPKMQKNVETEAKRAEGWVGSPAVLRARMVLAEAAYSGKLAEALAKIAKDPNRNKTICCKLIYMGMSTKWCLLIFL